MLALLFALLVSQSIAFNIYCGVYILVKDTKGPDYYCVDFQCLSTISSDLSLFEVGLNNGTIEIIYKDKFVVNCGIYIYDGQLLP